MAQKQDTTHASEDDAQWRNVRMRFPETDAIVERFLETQGARGISLAMRQLIYLFVAEYGDVEVATVIGLKLVESLQAGAEGSDLFAQLAAGAADVDTATPLKKAQQQTPSTTTRAPDQVNKFVAEAESQPVEESATEVEAPTQQVAPQPAQKPEQKPQQKSAQPAPSELDDGFDMDDVMGQAFGR